MKRRSEQGELDERTVDGALLVPKLAVGCLAFALAMGFGTYLLGKAVEPYFRHRFEQQQARDASVAAAREAAKPKR